MAADPRFDQYMAKIHELVVTHGWAVQGTTTMSGVPLTYSVGFAKTLGHPDVAFTGISSPLAQNLINTMGLRIREGEVFEVDVRYHDVIESTDVDLDVVFRAIPLKVYSDFFGVLRRYYGEQKLRRYSVLQCVWPDKMGRFPWEDDFDPVMRAAQVLIGD